jgi:hypothetical protein
MPAYDIAGLWKKTLILSLGGKPLHSMDKQLANRLLSTHKCSVGVSVDQDRIGRVAHFHIAYSTESLLKK